MHGFWTRSGIGIRSAAIAAATLLLAGAIVSIVTWLATAPGSASFDTGFTVARWLLQGCVALGLITLLVIITKRRRERTGT